MLEGQLPTAPLCPVCGKLLDGYFSCPGQAGEERAPTPGDITICFFCRAPLTVTDDIQLRSLTAGEILSLAWEQPEAFDLLFKLSENLR